MKIQCLGEHHGERYTAYYGDCVEVMKQFPAESIDFSVFSPPFGSIFTYSSSIADMGNAATDAEFFAQYAFCVKELYRLTLPGRLTAVHCSDLPLQKWKDGVIGIKDFSGDIIRTHQAVGWTLHARVTIWKSPVVEMTRTKALGLLYKQLQKDSARSRTGMADYLLVFRKDGDNPKPIAHTPETFSLDQWQEWASPVWMTVNQTRTLNVEVAQTDQSDKHVCPLQIDVIERAVILWSNEGDVVLSPFMGIGSEGVGALKLRRKFVGIELKKEYFDKAVDFLEAEDRQAHLFHDTSHAIAR